MKHGGAGNPEREGTMRTIAETLDIQGQIIRLQSEIIDRLAAQVLQYGQMAQEDLDAIRQAVELQQITGK